MNAQSKHTHQPKARILLVDDHPVVREGLARLIAHHDDMEIVGEASSADEALAVYEIVQPDLTIVDISLGGRDGLSLIKDMLTRWPGAKTLVLSMHGEGLYAERCLRAGARGYVMKQAPPEVLLEALREVLSGGVYTSAAVKSELFERIAQGAIEAAPMDGLTDRELEIFRMIGQGTTNAEIAARLTLSPKTIDTYRDRLKKKLGLKTGAELMQRAVLWVESGGG